MSDILRPSNTTDGEPVVTYMIDEKESTAIETVFDYLFEMLTKEGEYME